MNYRLEFYHQSFTPSMCCRLCRRILWCFGKEMQSRKQRGMWTLRKEMWKGNMNGNRWYNDKNITTITPTINKLYLWYFKHYTLGWSLWWPGQEVQIWRWKSLHSLQEEMRKGRFWTSCNAFENIEIIIRLIFKSPDKLMTMHFITLVYIGSKDDLWWSCQEM